MRFSLVFGFMAFYLGMAGIIEDTFAMENHEESTEEQAPPPPVTRYDILAALILLDELPQGDHKLRSPRVDNLLQYMASQPDPNFLP